jgi:hypothetical protein
MAVNGINGLEPTSPNAIEASNTARTLASRMKLMH